MKSMTGYGTFDDKHTDSDLTVVIKSVNGRFLDSRFHLPRELQTFESEFKKKLQKKVRRGTLDIFVSRRFSPSLLHSDQVDFAQKWVKRMRELAKKTKLNVDDNTLFAELLEAQQTVDGVSRKEVSKKEVTRLFQAFDKAFSKFEKERQREGQALQKAILQLCSELKSVVNKMSALRAEANKDLEAKVHARLKKMGFEGKIDDPRITQEVVFSLDKTDIDEELSRLKEHLSSFEKDVKGADSQGKKLDFYSQELLREVNTIGSKANLAALTEQVVLAKGLIETLKEMIQNVE